MTAAETLPWVMLHFAGPLSAQMAHNVVLMNAIAPLAAIVLYGRISAGGRLHLKLATVLQLVLLWGWHVPLVLPAALQEPLLRGAMQVSLLGSATWFWLAVLRVGDKERWRALVALLITMKLFCLLGALLALAPRSLYPLLPWPQGAVVEPLADQQLAGLLILVAGPASYLLGALAIAARWFAALERDGATTRSAGA
jgi:putative membrane protein